MPLSDDELLGIERITTALRNYPEPAHGGVMVSKGIIDHELGRVPELIAELRAARKVVGAAKRMSEQGPETYQNAWMALDEAVDEYDAASAEPRTETTRPEVTPHVWETAAQEPKQ